MPEKEQPKESEHEPKQKFNMDLKDQELLCKVMESTAKHSISSDFEIYYRTLKEITVLLDAGMHEDERVEQGKMQKQCRKDLAEFLRITSACGVIHSEETGKYMFSKESGNRNKFEEHAERYHELIYQLESKLDYWQAELRRVMKRLGLIMLKSKDGLDAAGA